MKRVNYLPILMIPLLILLCACTQKIAQPSSSTPVQSSVPSTETMWYQSIKLDRSTEWSAPVVETDSHFYYIAEDGVYEYVVDAKMTGKLTAEAARGLYLYENNLYYMTDHTVKRVNLQTKDISVVWDDSAAKDSDGYHYLSLNDFALLDGYLYIAGTGTSVMRVNLADYATEQFLGDCSSMVLLANDCYYLDHAERTFSLYRMTCDTKESTLLRGEGNSYPENMRIDGIAGIENTVAYSVRDGSDVYLYDPSGNDEKIFDGDNSGKVWLTLVPQWTGKELYFYTTDGSQLKLYDYYPETGVRLLTSFDCTTRLCNIVTTESAVFWWSEKEQQVKCFVKESD